MVGGKGGRTPLDDLEAGELMHTRRKSLAKGNAGERNGLERKRGQRDRPCSKKELSAQ